MVLHSRKGKKEAYKEREKREERWTRSQEGMGMEIERRMVRRGRVDEQVLKIP